MLYAAGVNVTQRVALAQRLAEVEAELQQAVHGLDGSPESRTRYQRARETYREVDAFALEVLATRRCSALASRESVAASPP